MGKEVRKAMEGFPEGSKRIYLQGLTELRTLPWEIPWLIWNYGFQEGTWRGTCAQWLGEH